MAETNVGVHRRSEEPEDMVKRKESMRRRDERQDASETREASMNRRKLN